MLTDEEGVCYEETNPDEYATSVYSAPHWMFSLENANKRRKLSAAAGEAPNFFPKTPSPRCENREYMPPIHDTSALLDTIDLSKKGASNKFKKKNLPLQIVETIPCLKQRKPEYESSYEDQVVSLFCNHCKVTFKAKPTYRRRFNHTLVNHACAGNKRKQYVLGVKRRKCLYPCSSVKGCIFRVHSYPPGSS